MYMNPAPSHGSKKAKTTHTHAINSGSAASAMWTHRHQVDVENQLMRLVAVEGQSFGTITSATFKRLCCLLNPAFRFPNIATLQERLRLAVAEKKQRTVNYIHSNIDRGAITADAWTSSHNKRKYLGVTFHYMARDYRLSSVVIGMERILARKVDAQVLTDIIGKAQFYICHPFHLSM
jgi:hypothetical protein